MGYFHSLFYFDAMLNGTTMHQTTNQSITNRDFFILQRLIEHRLDIKKNRFNAYINKTFSLFCKQKRQIILNLHQISVHFVKLRDLVFRTNSNLFDKILFDLFVNLETIIIWSTNRIPFREYEFSIKALSHLLDGVMAQDDMRLIVKAHADTDCRSWIFEEIFLRRSVDESQFVVEMKTTLKQKRFPIHSLTIYKM